MVSAVPEGLPIVVTIIMVVGALTLSKKKALVRYLPVQETLRITTVILSDKTGTNTEERLTVDHVFALYYEGLISVTALCNDTRMTVGIQSISPLPHMG